MGHLRRPRRARLAPLTHNPGQPDEECWPSKFTGHTLKAGDAIEITVPNSGGYGDPLERDPELVLSDVLDGFTTLERAERDYGVVIDAESMTVDVEADSQAPRGAERQGRHDMSGSSRDLPPRTRVAVIGGGIAGASITYHLTRLGWSDVTLLEADELTSGSTWHAAGLCTQFIGNPHIMRLLKGSLDLYETLEEETGQPVGLHRCGSVRLAENQDRVDQFHHVRGVAEQVGVPFEIVTPERAYELFPLITLDGVLAGAYLPTDGHVDPSGVTNALAQGATSRGARIMRRTPVTGMRHETDGWVIETAKGEIRADIVVNAAGQWARQVARLAGIDLPIVPLEHHYIVTEPVEEVRSRDTELPVLRDPEGSFYARQEGDALLVGPFEQNARPWSVDGVPDDFHGRLLPGRLDQIEDVLIAASRRIPFFETTGIKTIINGPDGYTPDGRCLMGWVPGLPNYFVLAGFSIFGIVFGGGAGGYAAEWLAKGEPSEDMWDLDVRRFGPYASANGFLIPKASDAYLREYAIEFPFEERDIARPLKTGALYDRLNERGAVWGMRFGWERPQWFDRGNGGHEEYSYRRTAWHDAVGEECRAVREGVGVHRPGELRQVRGQRPGRPGLPRPPLLQLAAPEGRPHGAHADVHGAGRDRVRRHRHPPRRRPLVRRLGRSHRAPRRRLARAAPPQRRLGAARQRHRALRRAHAGGPALARADGGGHRDRRVEGGVPVLQHQGPPRGRRPGARDARVLRG